jgi:hypothetical protein
LRHGGLTGDDRGALRSSPFASPGVTMRAIFARPSRRPRSPPCPSRPRPQRRASRSTAAPS